MSIARIAEIMNIGYKGSELITDTAVHTGSWKMVVPYEATVFTTLTDTNRTGNSIASESFPANFLLMGNFTTITLASGAVVAYK
jgi:hypothetical protein